MNVLMIVPAYLPIGRLHTGVFYHEHALAAAKTGCEVTIVAPELRSIRTIGKGLCGHTFRISAFERDGIGILKWKGWAIPTMPRLNAQLWMRAGVRLVEHYFAHHGTPDVIHAHWAWLSGGVALAIRKKYNIPYVVLEHFTGYARKVMAPWQLEQAGAALQGANVIATVSKSLATTIAPLCAGRSVHIVPNVVRTEFFREHITERLPSFHFLTVCRLTTVKGLDILLEAFASSFKGLPVQLRIGGDGPEYAKLLRLADSLGISPQVEFLGWLSREDLRSAMQESHAFVLASRFETFGVVVIEAMAAGLPVVVTSSGGPEEIVDPETGLVVPVEDPDALAVAMTSVYEKSAAWDARAGSIQQSVDKRYSQRVVGEKLRSLYQATSQGGDFA